MPTVVTCPECDTSLKLKAAPTPGKKVKCPKCAAVFAPEDAAGRRVSAERPLPAAPAPRRRADVEEDDDFDEEEPRPRRPRPKQGGGNGLLIGLLVGGAAVLALLLVVVIGVVAWVLRSGSPPQPVAQQSAPPVVHAGPMAQQIPAAPGNPPPPAAAVAEAPPGTYGDQGGEEIAPADPTLPDTLLRARADDTFYKLSNAHVGQGRFGQPTLFVDYEITKAGQYNGITLVVHGDDGRRDQYLLIGPTRSHGTLPISARGFGAPGRPPFPQNGEVYIIRSDGRYGAPVPTFKVSNSVTIGNMTRLTRARNWTPEEIARLTQPPPNYSNPNAHPNVGQDTPFAGNATGANVSRYVEPGGLLLGLDYRMGEWEKEKCFGGLTPVFSRTQPATPLCSRILAPEGYAVAGAKVRSKRYVDAVQLVFMRVKADGRLDPADSKTSEWFGDAGDQPEKTLGGDGTRVIGISLRAVAVVDGFALVLERPGDAKQ